VTGGGTEDLTATTPAAAAVLTAAMSSNEITFADVDADITVTIDSVALTVAVADFSAATDEASLVTALAASLNANADNTDWTFSASGTDLVATANTAGATVSTFTIASTGTDKFTGATVAETTAGADLIGFSVTETTAGADAVTAAGAFDISTRDAALASIVLMDAAISTVNTQRAELGAVSNRLDNTVSNLTNISINLEGGRGRIEDADFAAESTSLAKSQILQQASTAMLAQANASKQSVLSLLQG
jgi:flagellin